MSNILKRGETGFGILIEEDSGYVTQEINKHLMAEGFQFSSDEPILVNCILQKWGVENRNGRIYPQDVLIGQVQEFQKKVDEGSAVNESDHPESSTVSLQNISHIIKKMWWGTGEDQHILYGQLQIVVSPGFIKSGVCSMIGDKIIVYLQNGIKLGISSRGVGTLKQIKGKNIVQNDFELICFDLVSTPSTPGAYLFPKQSNTKIGESEIIKKDKTYESTDKIINALDRFLI